MTVETPPETVQSLIATIKILRRRADKVAIEAGEIQVELRKAEHQLDQLMMRLAHISEPHQCEKHKYHTDAIGEVKK